MRRLIAAVLAASATGAAADESASCRATLGAEAASLVEQCINVSPATHPPCNEENPCELIRGEIQRGCAYIRESGSDTPEYCAADPR